ncbi:MAG: sulfurtransferase TusA family protein [Inquilinaceae bacterium]
MLLDAKDMICPLPVLKARKALKSLPVGGILEVHATDRAARKDFAAFCAATGHVLLSAEAQGPVTIFRIEKAGV